MVKRLVPVTRGSLSHLIVPQSKTWVSTEAGVTKRRPSGLAMVAPLRMPAEMLETSYLLGDCAVGGQAFDARGAKKSGDALRSAQDVLDVVRLSDGAAMAQDQNVGAHGDCCLLDGLNTGHRLIEGDGSPGADGSFRGETHVCNQQVRAGLRHVPRLLFIEDIRAGEQIECMRACNHLHFQGVSHSGFFQILAANAGDQPNRGKG